MAASEFNLVALHGFPFVDMDEAELPPFSTFLEGTTGARHVHLAGPLGAPGQISGLKFDTGGFRYTDIPISESAFLLEGSVRVSSSDKSFIIREGEGFLLPQGWSGTVEALSPVTKIFHVL